MESAVAVLAEVLAAQDGNSSAEVPPSYHQEAREIVDRLRGLNWHLTPWQATS